MKKIWIIIGCYIFLFAGIFVVNNSIVQEASISQANSTNGYALVKNNNCYLYKYIVENPLFSNKYFLLEKTYYVKVIENADENFYKVEYNDITGYVKKNEIEFVKETPENPFLENITFDIYSGSSVELRNEPSTQGGVGSIITTIPAGQKNLFYYGKIAGEESIKGLGNIWYYCSYTLSNGVSVKGYVYSPLTINLSAINENNEQLTTVSVKNYVPINSLLYLNLSTKNIIIILLSIPSLFVVYLFVKPTKILKK